MRTSVAGAVEVEEEEREQRKWAGGLVANNKMPLARALAIWVGGHEACRYIVHVYI